MRIAIVTAFPRDPAQPHGGVEAVSVNLVRAMAARGDCEVDVVTVDTNGVAPETTTWNGAQIHRLPRSGGQLLTYAVGKGRRQVSEYVANLKPEVVHAHDTYGLMVKGLDLPR